MTKSIEAALSETNRRRAVQQEYNEKNNINPETIRKNISTLFSVDKVVEIEDPEMMDLIKDRKKLKKNIEIIKKQMLKAASNLDFELAAKLRDKMIKLEKADLDFT